MEKITSRHTSYLKAKVGLEWAFWAESKLKLISILILFLSPLARLYSIIYLNILQILHAKATDSTIQNTSNILQILHTIAINILHI